MPDRDYDRLPAQHPLVAERDVYKRARDEALYALIGGDGPPDTTTAQLWLRTTLPSDHPNYVDPATLTRKEPE